MVGVAAGATPGAETAASGEAYGYLHSREWWGVCVASLVLTLVCYGAMLRQQLGLAAGQRPQLLQSLRDAARDVPAVLLLVAAWMVPLLPAFASTAWRGFDVLALLLTAAGSGLLLYALPAWPAMIAGNTTAWLALNRAIQLVRGRWLQFAGMALALAGGTLVFALLAGILITLIMNLAGQGTHPTLGALALSRWLIALVLAVPVVYVGAVSVMAWRVATRSC